MKRNWMKKMAVSLLATVTLVGCGGPSGSGAKEVVVNLGQEPPQMDSILTTSTGSMNVLRHCVEGLVALDEKDNPIPGVAEKWDVSDDKMTYTFHLRKDSKWNNGEAVTAKDFVYSLNQHFNAQNGAPYAGTWATKVAGAGEILEATGKTTKGEDGKEKFVMSKEEAEKYTAENATWKAVDDYTFEITFAGPYPYALAMMAFPSFFPVNQKAYEAAGGNGSYGTEADKIAYNGAFTITSWTHEDNIVLEKNPDYWNKDEINLEKITMRMIKDENAAYNEFKNGTIDMIGLTGSQLATAEKDGLKVQNFDDGGSWYLEYNTKIKGLNNKKVRQALTLAVDAEQYIKTIVQNKSTVANSFTPVAIANGEYTKLVGDLIKRPTNGDYSEAKKLLEEGLKEEGLNPSTWSLHLIADDTAETKKTVAYLQEQFNKNLGVKVEVEQITYKARLARMEEKDFEVVLAGWGPDYNDPMTFIDIFTTGNGNNHTSYSNPEYDKGVKEALKIGDKDKYYAKLKELETILIEDSPIGMIYFRKKDYVTSDKVTGIVRTAFQDFNLLYADVK